MNVRILATAAVATVAALGTAAAADLPTHAPAYKAPPAPVSNWTGCYLGGGGGYGTQNSYVTAGGVPITASQTNGGEGWFGQGQAGCDYQFMAPILNVGAVIGAFGDYEAGSLKGTSTFPGLGGDERETSAWAAGGRVGLLAMPRMLSYVDGGWTWAHFGAVNYSIALPGGGPSGIGLAAQTYNGWFLGSGFEYAVDWLPLPGLFLKTEYRYSRYASPDGVSVPLIGLPATAGVVALNSQKNIQTISTELVWRFNWSGGR